MDELYKHDGVSEDVPESKVGTFLNENYGKGLVVLVMGTASGLANIEHGPTAVFTAGLKQSAYSAASAAVFLTLCNSLAKRVRTLPGELIPIVVPTLLTIAANYGVHNLRGTVEPALSTLPTAVVATLGFPIWHIRRRILELWKDIEDIKIVL
ncbi:hypothetical protein KBD59_06095 [Candidatus Gracilibacteria bacterium]|nr:hypothetical protein [Candidatus Gracilibacteria bacterium]